MIRHQVTLFLALGLSLCVSSVEAQQSHAFPSPGDVGESATLGIEPENWDVAYALGLAGVKPIPDEFTVHWRVVPHFADTVAPTATVDPSVETVVTVAQGLAGRRHTLEISGGPDTPITAVRVYRPPLESQGK